MEDAENARQSASAYRALISPRHDQDSCQEPQAVERCSSVRLPYCLGIHDLSPAPGMWSSNYLGNPQGVQSEKGPVRPRLATPPSLRSSMRGNIHGVITESSSCFGIAIRARYHPWRPGRRRGQSQRFMASPDNFTLKLPRSRAECRVRSASLTFLQALQQPLGLLPEVSMRQWSSRGHLEAIPDPLRPAPRSQGGPLVKEDKKLV